MVLFEIVHPIADRDGDPTRCTERAAFRGAEPHFLHTTRLGLHAPHRWRRPDSNRRSRSVKGSAEPC
jgi:hypothetical protein